MEYNDLTGTIPSELGQLTALSLLNLSLNLLTGQIPSELGMLVNLQEITLYRNIISGTVPESLTKMISLRRFDISSQQFDSNTTPPKELSGSFPRDWSKCTSLEVFNIEQNFFVGSLPFLFNTQNLSESILCCLILCRLSTLTKFHISFAKLITLPEITTFLGLYLRSFGR